MYNLKVEYWVAMPKVNKCIIYCKFSYQITCIIHLNLNFKNTTVK